jgi:hypothetical protein
MGTPTWTEIETYVWNGISGNKPNLEGSAETQDTVEDKKKSTGKRYMELSRVGQSWLIDI